MIKKERQRLLDIALDVYRKTDITLSSLADLFRISKIYLSRFMRQNGVAIRLQYKEMSVYGKAVRMFKKKSIEEISNELNVDKDILQLLYDNRKPSRKECLRLIAKEYVDTPSEVRSITKLSKRYGVKRSTIIDYLNKKNIKQTKERRYRVSRNSYIFDKIDTEEKAYWLGFMYADGCVATTGNEINISLSIRDLVHLQKFAQFTQYQGKICFTQSKIFSSDTSGRISNIVSLTINDTRMHEMLIEKGCVPNKSLILKFPDERIFCDRKLIYDFIRGYVDGDGTLGVYPHSKKNPNLEATLAIVSTKPFLEEVQKYLGDGNLYHKSNCSRQTYRLDYHTRKAEHAAELLYKNANVYLDRKYKIYITKFTALKSGKNGES